MRILVVDDDTRLLAELERILLKSGYSVDCATSADDAVAKVGANLYDFVLVDYRMPEHDGFWFMKNANVPRRTRVLLVTAYVDKHVVSQMFSAGISGYVMKPFDESQLLMHLQFYSDKEKSLQGDI